MGLGPDRGERRARYVAKARAELGDLAARGVVMAGNAFSSVVLVKGLPGEGERGAQGLLTKQDGSALRAALQALGYAPEDWAGLAAWDDTGELLSVELFREVASGAYTPESWSDEGGDGADSNLALPEFGAARRRFILNEYL